MTTHNNETTIDGATFEGEPVSRGKAVELILTDLDAIIAGITEARAMITADDADVTPLVGAAATLVLSLQSITVPNLVMLARHDTKEAIVEQFVTAEIPDSLPISE